MRGERNLQVSSDVCSWSDCSYHAQHIILLARALQHALKICLQIEETGFLCVQVMMPIPENMAPDMHNGILDFKVSY